MAKVPPQWLNWSGQQAPSNPIWREGYEGDQLLNPVWQPGRVYLPPVKITKPTSPSPFASQKKYVKDYQDLLQFSVSNNPNYRSQQQYDPTIDPNPKNNAVKPPTTTTTPPPASDTSAQDLVDYNYLVESYKGSYQNALKKYELQVQQAEQSAKDTGREAYITLMNQNRVRGNVLASKGLANSGYVNLDKVQDLANYNKNYSGAIGTYNKNIQNVNQNISDLAYGYNQDLADTYNKYASKVPTIKKQTVGLKKYATK